MSQLDSWNSYNLIPGPPHEGQNIPFNMKAKAYHSLPFLSIAGYLRVKSLQVVLKVELPSPIPSVNSHSSLFLSVPSLKPHCLLGVFTCQVTSGPQALPLTILYEIATCLPVSCTPSVFLCLILLHRMYHHNNYAFINSSVCNCLPPVKCKLQESTLSGFLLLTQHDGQSPKHNRHLKHFLKQ